MTGTDAERLTAAADPIAYLLGATGLVLRDIFDRYSLTDAQRERVLTNAGDALRVTATHRPPRPTPGPRHE